MDTDTKLDAKLNALRVELEARLKLLEEHPDCEVEQKIQKAEDRVTLYLGSFQVPFGSDPVGHLIDSHKRQRLMIADYVAADLRLAKWLGWLLPRRWWFWRA